MNEPSNHTASELQRQRLPSYKCHKVVQAFAIGRIEGLRLISEDEQFWVDVSAEYLNKHPFSQPGYYVTYEDGYESFSPKQAFEDGYTLIPREGNAEEYDVRMGVRMADVLLEAKFEIERLRRRNEVLEGKVQTMEIFAAALHANVGHNGVMGMVEDVAWKLQLAADSLTPKKAA